MIHDVLELRPTSFPPATKAFARYFQKPKIRKYGPTIWRRLRPSSGALRGESGNPFRRVREHLHGESQFGSTVAEDPDLSWIDLDLFYWELSEASEKESPLRKAIELVTTAVTIGGFTRRPG